ncbi:uncharacterized protein LOC116843346 [Odontomachus brunneus]|uniref:uncharacterized protein LOC116843346 n=1 Tax=Odontomachus brunneus TaxID=486640 RepID=UPI0013F1A077|nr:uncharacterized protein LOC116843346 [Odontomachus brunneus]
MENGKSKENRRARGRRRNSKKEDNRESEQMSEEPLLWSDYSIIDNEDTVGTGTMERGLSPNTGNVNGDEGRSTFSLMSPALRRQLQTHKNILRLLHENKLVSTQINGQRILSVQPIRWSGPTPGIDCEIFVGRIPKTIYEDTLYPLFRVIGEIFQIRLMVDMAELTRGYCFIMYTNPEDAAKAITQLDQHEILPGKKIRVLASVNKCKLYVGPLPWHITSEEVVRVIYASAWDIECVSIYRFLNHDAAYAIVSFKSHRNAALARRKLRPERLFKCNEVHVEWARVDWNPSNVYEDRGIVDSKGDVQITRKHLQFKKATYSSAPKSLSPISPPDYNIKSSPSKDLHNSSGSFSKYLPSSSGSPSKNIHSSIGTRYSNMLTMTAALNNSLPDDPSNKTPDVDAHSKVQLLDDHCDAVRDQIDLKDSNKDNFRNFDMWNSSLVSQLPRWSTSSNSSKNHVLSTKVLDVPGRSCESNMRYMPLNTLPTPYQYTNNIDILNCRDMYHYLSNERIDYSQPIAADIIPHQLPLYRQNYPEASYVTPQPSVPSMVFQHPYDAAAYEKYLIFNYSRNIPEIDMSSHIYLKNQSHVRDESVAVDRSFNLGKKKNDRRIRSAKTLTKTENDFASLYISNVASSKIRPDTPKFTQKHARRVLSENTLFRTDINDERRLRPILKQTTDRILP